jgi:hypothetical protein
LRAFTAIVTAALLINKMKLGVYYTTGLAGKSAKLILAWISGLADKVEEQGF